MEFPQIFRSAPSPYKALAQATQNRRDEAAQLNAAAGRMDRVGMHSSASSLHDYSAHNEPKTTPEDLAEFPSVPQTKAENQAVNTAPKIQQQLHDGLLAARQHLETAGRRYDAALSKAVSNPSATTLALRQREAANISLLTMRHDLAHTMYEAANAKTVAAQIAILKRAPSEKDLKTQSAIVKAHDTAVTLARESDKAKLTAITLLSAAQKAPANRGLQLRAERALADYEQLSELNANLAADHLRLARQTA